MTAAQAKAIAEVRAAYEVAAAADRWHPNQVLDELLPKLGEALNHVTGPDGDALDARPTNVLWSEDVAAGIAAFKRAWESADEQGLEGQRVERGLIALYFLGWTPPNAEHTAATRLVAAERTRQIVAEGFDPEHDAQPGHAEELTDAGIAYAQAASSLLAAEREGAGDSFREWLLSGTHQPEAWPWAPGYWKPTGELVRDLTKAAALLVAAADALLAEAHRGE